MLRKENKLIISSTKSIRDTTMGLDCCTNDNEEAEQMKGTETVLRKFPSEEAAK